MCTSCLSITSLLAFAGKSLLCSCPQVVGGRMDYKLLLSKKCYTQLHLNNQHSRCVVVSLIALRSFNPSRSNFLHFSRNSICKNNVCRNRPQVVPHVVHGLLVALRECQHQFRNRRWNCTEKSNSLEKIMRYGKS